MMKNITLNNFIIILNRHDYLFIGKGYNSNKRCLSDNFEIFRNQEQQFRANSELDNDEVITVRAKL